MADEIDELLEYIFQSAEEDNVFDVPKRSRGKNKNINLMKLSDGC
jgi:hypothetical protein